MCLTPMVLAVALALRSPADSLVAQTVASGLLLIPLVIGPIYLGVSAIDPRLRQRIGALLAGERRA
jgi:hypothetical protein